MKTAEKLSIEICNAPRSCGLDCRTIEKAIESRDAEHEERWMVTAAALARSQEKLDARDAEIHALYAPVMEALKATPALRMQNGPHKGLMRLELFLDESTLAAIKEVKG